MVRRCWLSRQIPAGKPLPVLESKQYAKPLADIGDDAGWSFRLECHLTRLPVEVLDMIGKNNA